MKYTRHIQGCFAALALAVVLLAPSAHSARVPLQQGTEAIVTFAADGKIKSGEHAVGDTLEITLARPIIIGNQVIVEDGASGKAVVAEIKPSGKGGKPGYIKVSFVSLMTKGTFKTLDGAPIPLEGTIDDKGGGKKLLSYLFIAGLFIKGGQGEIDANAEYPVTVTKTVVLSDE